MLIRSRSLSSSSRRFVDLQNKLSDNVVSGYNHLKGSLFQAMAHRMNAKDKAEMLRFWADDSTKNEFNQNLPTFETEMKTQSSQPPPRILPTPKFDLETITEDSTLYHPILGEKLVDLGYKTLYLTSVRSLAVAPIWKKQRILRPERSQLIANDKIKNNLGSSLSGSISFFMDRKTKEIGIIDGQHRAGALMILAQKGHWDEKVRNIVIEVFSTNSQAQVGALFREINAAEPVRLVDLLMQEEAPLADGPMVSLIESGPTLIPIVQDEKGSIEFATELPVPSTDGVIKRESLQLSPEDLVTILDSAADSLSGSYPDMFKPSSRCKPPHLNVDVLRDDLFQSDFLPRHGVRSAADLLALLDRVNNSLKEQLPLQDTEALSKSAATALKKATEHGFYLGLDKAWIYLTHLPATSAAAKPHGTAKKDKTDSR